MLFTGQVFLPSQQLGVDLREFLELLLELAIVLDPLFSCSLLTGCLEEELIDCSNRQALSQVIKGAVLVCAMMAVAIGLATGGQSLDQRGPQAIGQGLEMGKQEAFAFAQSQGGFAGVIYLCHI